MDRPLAAAVAVSIAAVGAALVAWPRHPEAPPVEIDTAVAPRTLTVHVSGAVLRPGLVTLESGARVADAIIAAGGARPSAELGALNLAATVSDGVRLSVPAAGGPESTGDGLIRVNAATASDLEALPGVGPVLAQRIASHREEFGSFSVVEDLLSVAGIGEAKLDALRDLVIVP